MITYEQLSSFLKKQREYPVSFRKNYFVVMVRGTRYHITVFQDQWNDYEKVTGMPYHLDRKMLQLQKLHLHAETRTEKVK